MDDDIKRILWRLDLMDQELKEVKRDFKNFKEAIRSSIDHMGNFH